MRQNKFEYDAFISHAVEDKIPIANELCAKLERAGLKIWYSGKELGVGDSIEKTIERGLNRSRYGIVIFSPTYLAKNWTIREFYTLLAKEIEEQKVILPVLYNISLDELKNKDLVMADRFALNSDRGLDFVVDQLVREIKRQPVVKKKEAWFSGIWTLLIVSILVNIALLLKTTILPVMSPGMSAYDVRMRDHAVRPGELMSEMQYLLTRAGACQCQDESKEQPYRLQARFTPVSQRPAVTSEPVRVTERNVRNGNGSKMTMAVVFQIESEDAGSGDGEMDDILDMVSLPERNASERSGRQQNSVYQTCNHTAYHAD